LFTLQQIISQKKIGSRPVSRVLYIPASCEAGCVCHLSWFAVSGKFCALYPPASDEQPWLRRCTWVCNPSGVLPHTLLHER